MNFKDGDAFTNIVIDVTSVDSFLEIELLEINNDNYDFGENKNTKISLECKQNSYLFQKCAITNIKFHFLFQLVVLN